MVHTLRRGENVSLSGLAASTTRVTVGVGWEVDVVAGTLDADVFALLVGADGQVVSDAHLVFYNNHASPTGAVRLAGVPDGAGVGDDRQRVVVDLAGTPPEVERVVVAVAVYAVGESADGERRTLSDVRDLFLRIVDDPADGPVPDAPDHDGAARADELVRYDVELTPTIEDALVLGEIYRLGEEWKVVAVGQGYASGLEGVATEFGVHV